MALLAVFYGNLQIFKINCENLREVGFEIFKFLDITIRVIFCLFLSSSRSFYRRVNLVLGVILGDIWASFWTLYNENYCAMR